MSEQRWEDPHNEGAARAAQMAAMAATLMESLVRLRATRAADRADIDERHAAAARADRLARHATDRVAWTPAFDADWLRKASSGDLARAWSAAILWESTDRDAADAARRVESALHLRHPEAMAEYLEARAEGLDPGAAMRRAAPLFARPLAIEASASDTRAQAHEHRDRDPRAVAADGFPIPTAAALVARPNGSGAVLITTASARATRQPTSANTR